MSNEISLRNINYYLELENANLPIYAAKNSSKFLTRRLYGKEEDKERLAFQRDRDRIIHSRAFRRLMHKTQIFCANKGDHFRNRLTHTLEVSQISRSIAKRLGLNEELTEAIALGHDLGHTPFGHIGEQTLHNIISGRMKIDGELNSMPNAGGFKHNYQGLHLVDNLEQNASHSKGMNLTLAVREGILKHTKRSLSIKIRDYKNDKIDKIVERIDYGNNINLEDININDPSFTLEGQVVAISDEIAQCTHDLEDGIRAGVINMKDLKNSDLVNDVCEKYQYNYLFTQHLEVAEIRNTLIKKMIGFLLNNAAVNTMAKLKEVNLNNIYIESKGAIIFKNLIVDFDADVAGKVKELYKLITNLVINSVEVSITDSKAIYLITELFKSYYTYPQQLPEYILKKYYKGKGISVNRKDIEEMTFQFRRDPLFIRLIGDHISSMTDQYAIREYDKLHSSKFYG